MIGPNTQMLIEGDQDLADYVAELEYLLQSLDQPGEDRLTDNHLGGRAVRLEIQRMRLIAIILQKISYFSTLDVDGVPAFGHDLIDCVTSWAEENHIASLKSEGAHLSTKYSNHPDGDVRLYAQHSISGLQEYLEGIPQIS